MGQKVFRPSWVFVATVVACGIAPVSGALAQQGPSMNSFYLNAKPTEGECCANLTFVQNLPPERKQPVPAVTLEKLGKGKYVMVAASAAPFPTAPERGGFFVAVTAIGSNAHCFESETLVRGARDLVGTVDCVDPKGAPVDSEFSWSYRADSYDFVQFTTLPKNFGYAQVYADGKTGVYFSPIPGAGVQVQHPERGVFKIKFPRLGTSGGMDPKVGAGVLVSNICPRGLGDCGTNTCVPTAWSVGASASTIDVRCADRTGAPVDNAFRAFLGQEALNSQAFGKFENPADYKKFHQHYNEGTNYGWVVSSEKSAPTGKDPLPKPHITYMNKGKDFPGPRKIDYFHVAPGQYRVKFRDQLVYGQTYWSMHTTARENQGGTYCNVGELNYRGIEVGVNCFDGNGAPRDATWFLSMRRLYN